MDGSDDPVASAFAGAPRRLFLPADQHRHADEDRPLPLGHGQTSSQPSTVAAMLRLLDVRPGQRVLDVGAGSGWTTALLALLTGPGGQVHGVELEPDLVRRARDSLALWGREAPPHADVAVSLARPGALGDADGAPWSRIMVSAQARELPAELADQLADDGVMVVPVAGEMLRVVRSPGRTTTTTHGAYRFVPLRPS